jgi:hypothetical protein
MRLKLIANDGGRVTLEVMRNVGRSYNPAMDTNEIVRAIDAEIQRLQEARALLAEGSGRSGRAKAAKPGRRLSAAARAQIVAAQRRDGPR